MSQPTREKVITIQIKCPSVSNRGPMDDEDWRYIQAVEAYKAKTKKRFLGAREYYRIAKELLTGSK